MQQGPASLQCNVILIYRVLEFNGSLRFNDSLSLCNRAQPHYFIISSHMSIICSDLELRDHIVLDPVWLIDALKLVITSDRFAVRIPKLAEKWIDFYKTGVIYRSTIGW